MKEELDFEEMAYITHAYFGNQGMFIGLQRKVFHSGMFLNAKEAIEFCREYKIRDISDLVNIPVLIRTQYVNRGSGSPKHTIKKIFITLGD